MLNTVFVSSTSILPPKLSQISMWELESPLQSRKTPRRYSQAGGFSREQGNAGAIVWAWSHKTAFVFWQWSVQQERRQLHHEIVMLVTLCTLTVSNDQLVALTVLFWSKKKHLSFNGWEPLGADTDVHTDTLYARTPSPPPPPSKHTLAHAYKLMHCETRTYGPIHKHTSTHISGPSCSLLVSLQWCSNTNTKLPRQY